MQSILIVEDDIYISDMVSNRLQQEGFHVLKAFSGTEALLVLASQKPDLILLDLMLPGLSGEEVLPKIQQTPVIIMSAKSEVNDKVQLLLNGAADYVTKPFQLEELVASVTHHIISFLGTYRCLPYSCAYDTPRAYTAHYFLQNRQLFRHVCSISSYKAKRLR